MSLYYKLTITKYEDNPRKGQAMPGCYRGEAIEPDMLETRTVEVVIKEEELDCLKQALLKVWK
jgi:hypothetical protein